MQTCPVAHHRTRSI